MRVSGRRSIRDRQRGALLLQLRRCDEVTTDAARCPRCAAELRAGQDWCLECGAAARTRLVRATAWRVPVAAVAVVVVLAGAAAAFAFVRLADTDIPATQATAPAAAPPATTTAPAPSPFKTTTQP